MLDMYSNSMLGYDTKDQAFVEANTFLKSKNANEDLNSPDGLVGEQRKFCKFNGAVDSEQLDWLDNTLCKAEREGKKVIVAGNPLYFIK